MPDDSARLLSLQWYCVQPLPVYHVAADDTPWSLDRPNQRALPLDGDASRPYTGHGVRLFILDTSIFPNLPEFEDRQIGGTDYLADGVGLYSTCNSDHTHATIVASAAVG